jgi:hypothetical protein
MQINMKLLSYFHYFIQNISVVDPNLFFPDPDPTLTLISDPDPNSGPDPDSNPDPACL